MSSEEIIKVIWSRTADVELAEPGIREAIKKGMNFESLVKLVEDGFYYNQWWWKRRRMAIRLVGETLYKIIKDGNYEDS